jgi:medium-chain acyl-[acyl-carrier-protein] hydrolase
MSAIETYSYKIRSYHTDGSGVIFIHQLLNFLQDAAHNHADGFGFGQKQLAEFDLVWVLSRLNIEIGSLPRHGETIELSTWVKSIRGSISEREFRIEQGGSLLVSASSLWFCLSSKSHKPVRLQASLVNIMKPYDTYATVEGTIKIGEVGPERVEAKHFEAQYSDIDMVDHVNNATYARWGIDELQKSFLSEKQISKLIINYNDQCFLGDSVEASHSSLDKDGLYHEINNTSSGSTLCRMRSYWE